MNPDYPNSEGCYIARLERTMRDVPEKYHDYLWDRTGNGKSPHVIQAAVEYIEDGLTLQEAADRFDTNRKSISDILEDMIDADVVTLQEVRDSSEDNGFQKFGEKRYLGDDAGETFDHDEITNILSEHDMTLTEFAGRVGVSVAAVHEWEDPDSYKPSPPAAKRIRKMIDA